MVWNTAQRRAACGKAFILYLYEKDAHGGNFTASVAGFSETPFSRMKDPADQRLNPPRFSEEDVRFVVDMLYRRGLIDGVDTAEGGIFTAWLTDDGNDCAEQYDGDFQLYLDRKAGSVSTTNFNIGTVSGGQFATGDNAHQQITNNTSASNGGGQDDLVLVLQGLIELLKNQPNYASQFSDSQQGRELLQAETEVRAELEAAEPDEQVVKTRLQTIVDAAVKIGTPGAGALVTAAANALVSYLSSR